jgi:hypothetical protein
MFIAEPLPFIKAFVEDLDDALKKIDPNAALSMTQKGWLAFCCLGILVTNSLCWARMERGSLGSYTLAAMSWMFRRSKIDWELLLHGGVKAVLKRYGIYKGILVVDESDKKRSKGVKRIFRAHKLKDKSSGGYIIGQSIVLLVLVTPLVTIPVGFSFYIPDPALTAWYKLKKEIDKKGKGKKKLPGKPKRNQEYPTKPLIALALLSEFRAYHPEVQIKCVVADALYGTDEFLSEASRIFGGIQVISQLRNNQNVRSRGQQMSVEAYFAKYGGGLQEIKIRGGGSAKVMVGSARLYVLSHKKKRFVIALKYEGEEEYRYLVAADLSWRTLDIVQAYTFGWLIEVFFEDWKSYEGWGQLIPDSRDEEGSRRGLILSLLLVILSLLLDHCLLLHPDQTTRLENKLPASTTGSLIEKVKVESLLQLIRSLLFSDNPQQQLQRLSEAVEEVFQLAPSKKHMINRDLGRLKPTPALKYRVEEENLAA